MNKKVREAKIDSRVDEMARESKKFPTIKDIAQQAKVSTATVLRIVHNNGYVAEKTRQKVLAVIKEQGYEMNLIAQSLRKIGDQVGSQGIYKRTKKKVDEEKRIFFA